MFAVIRTRFVFGERFAWDKGQSDKAGGHNLSGLASGVVNWIPSYVFISRYRQNRDAHDAFITSGSLTCLVYQSRLAVTLAFRKVFLHVIAIAPCTFWRTYLTIKTGLLTRKRERTEVSDSVTGAAPFSNRSLLPKAKA
jgi:hypothetical protein